MEEILKNKKKLPTVPAPYVLPPLLTKKEIDRDRLKEIKQTTILLKPLYQ